MSKNSKWMLALASAALLVVGQPEILAADIQASPDRPRLRRSRAQCGPRDPHPVGGRSARDRVTPVREEAVAPRKPLVAGISALAVAANASANALPVSDATAAVPGTGRVRSSRIRR